MGINAGQTFWHAIKNEICPLGASVGGGCFIYHGAPYPNFFWIAAPQSAQQSVANTSLTVHEDHAAYVETLIPCGDWFVPTAQELSDVAWPGCAYWVHDNTKYWAGDIAVPGCAQRRCWIQMGTGQISYYTGNNTTYRIRAFRKVSY